MTTDIRCAERSRRSAETDISLRLVLDGEGKVDVQTGFGLLDHMLHLTFFWAGMDLHLRCRGDMHIDAHHSAEDVALVLGQALLEALGDRKGIERVGYGRVPMDEALAEVTLDLSGRPWLEWRGDELLVSGYVVLVCVNADRKVVRMSRSLIDACQCFLEAPESVK